MNQTRIFFINCTLIYFHSCNQCYNPVKIAEVDSIESFYFVFFIRVIGSVWEYFSLVTHLTTDMFSDDLCEAE